MHDPPQHRIDPLVALRSYARAHGGRVRAVLYGSANLPGGGRVSTTLTVEGRPVKMFAGPLAVELEMATRSPAPFSINQPDKIYGNQRAVRVFEGITIHASDERGFVAAHAWLSPPEVRSYLEHIASVDAAYGLHVLGKQVCLVAAAAHLDVLVPALVSLATSLEAIAGPEQRDEGDLPPSLAPLMRFTEFAVGDDLDRSELFETRADDVQRVAREVEPLVAEIERYLGASTVWTKDMHRLSALRELVREARLFRPADQQAVPTITAERTARFACPCCRYLTLEERPPGTFAICPVCFWEDDPVQFDDPTHDKGANTVSLAVARENFLKLGAASPESRVHVRAPRPDERP